nr:hypothetical protein [Tanacetum cinerariifolium]
MTDYSLWEVILNGDSPIPTRVIDGVVQSIAPTTFKQRLARKNELKAREKRFGGYKETKKHNKSVSGVASVSTASAKVPISALPNVDTLSDAVECYNSHGRGHFARECRSPKDTRRNVSVEPQRRNLPVETSTSGALVSQCYGVGSYDWSFQAEKEPTNYALMAFTSSSSSISYNESQFNVISYKTGLESVKSRILVYQQNETVYEEDIKLLKLDVQLRDNALVDLRKKFKKAEQERDELKLKLEKFQTSSKNLSQLLASQTNDKTGLGYDNQVFTSFMFDCDEQFSSEFGVSMPASPVNDRYQSGEGYHAVPLPYTGTFMPPKPDLVLHDALTVNETIHTAFNVELSPTKPDKDLTYRPSAPIIKDWVSDLEDESEDYARMTHPNPHRHVVPTPVLTRSKLVPLTAARPVTIDVPHNNVIRPRPAKTVGTKPHLPPRRHINRRPSPKPNTFPQKVTTAKVPQVNAVKGDMSYLIDFKEINGEYVAFGGDPKGGKITDPHNTDDDATFEVKEPEFEVEKPDSKVHVSPSSKADFFNLETNITVSLIPTTRVHKDHPVTQIIEEPKRVQQALKDPSWIEVMQEELLQFKMQKVWVLVDLPNGKRAIGHTQEEGIDYEEVFTPFARIEDIRLFLAYASFMGFMVYRMDVKSAFFYGTIEEEKEEEKQIGEEQVAKARYWKMHVCYDDDDDYTIAITHKEPDNSLSMGDEHLDTIPVTESDEFIKSSVENLVLNPSESEGEYECDVLVCEDFTTFSNILFDADYDFSSSDDQSFYDEDIPKESYSNPLFDEEIISMKIDPHHFNADELTLLKSIPPGINETDCDPEEETRFIKRLLYDNSSPHPPEEFISKNSDTAFESFSPFPIPVEDSYSLMEEIDLSFTPNDPMPPSIEEDDYDSKRDILILEELFRNDSLSLLENESFYFDISSSSHPPAKPPDGNSGILNVKVMGDIYEHKVPMPRLMSTLVPNQDKSSNLLPHLGHKAFQPFAECPMMIYGKNTHILDSRRSEISSFLKCLLIALREDMQQFSMGNFAKGFESVAEKGEQAVYRLDLGKQDDMLDMEEKNTDNYSLDDMLESGNQDEQVVEKGEEAVYRLDLGKQDDQGLRKEKKRCIDWSLERR